MSLVLEGTLSDVGLCDLLRLIAREKRSGALRVTIDGCSLRFALRDGQLSGVRSDGDEIGIEAAVLSLVRHQRGAFRLEPPSADDPEGEGDAPATGANAEVLATAGEMELVRLAEAIGDVGGDESRPLRDAFPTPRQMDAFSADARAVYALVNGERTLGELILRSRLDPAIVLEELSRLADEALVRLEPRTAARSIGRLAPLVEAAAGTWRDWTAAALPLVTLVAWLAISGGGVELAATDPFQIRHDPLAAARAEHELERLRAAVEAHRFAEGRWPERLEALVSQGYVPATALADAQGRPYYYATRDGEYVLLAPER